jgi:hypothetical protein
VSHAVQKSHADDAHGEGGQEILKSRERDALVQDVLLDVLQEQLGVGDVAFERDDQRVADTPIVTFGLALLLFGFSRSPTVDQPVDLAA